LAEAETDIAQAEVALAQARRRSDLALQLNYGREGDENIVMAGIAVSLPFVNPKKSVVLQAKARRNRAKIAAEAKKIAISAEIEGARSTYAAAVAAVNRMARDVLPRQLENESMAKESYVAGKIDLTTLLQVRHDVIETQQEYLLYLSETAQAGVQLAKTVRLFSSTQ